MHGLRKCFAVLLFAGALTLSTAAPVVASGYVVISFPSPLPPSVPPPSVSPLPVYCDPSFCYVNVRW